MKLQELLAKIGMPLQQSRQSYQYITPVLRNHLKSQLENETIQNDYNLVQPGIIFRSNSYYHRHHLCHHHHLSSSSSLILPSILIYILAFHHFICHHLSLSNLHYFTYYLSMHASHLSSITHLSSIMHLHMHLSSIMHLYMHLSSIMHLYMHLSFMHLVYHLSCLYRSFCRYHGFKNPISATDLVQAVLALTGR